MEDNILIKRLAMFLSTTVALLMTTAYTSDDISDEKETEQSITAESSAAEIEVTEEAPEETTFFEEETTAAVEETTVKAETEDFVPVEGFSEKYWGTWRTYHLTYERRASDSVILESVIFINWNCIDTLLLIFTLYIPVS